MSRVERVALRYLACQAVSQQGVQLIAVGDPVGAQLNATVRFVKAWTSEDNPEPWDQLLRAAAAMRWQRLFQPQPNHYNLATLELVKQIEDEVELLRHVVAEPELLDLIQVAARAASSDDSPVGSELLCCLEEVGPKDCLVLANNGRARVGLTNWLERSGVRVAVQGEVRGAHQGVAQTYVIGPPAFYEAGIVSAPTSDAITFVMPSWFANRSLKPTMLSGHLGDPITVATRVFETGDTTEAPGIELGEGIEDEYVPQPDWTRSPVPGREPRPDEVAAHKILLRGGFVLWLDEAEHIRSFHPQQPEGHRVHMRPIDEVQPGCYLVLREGVTERAAMYAAALAGVGAEATAITESQNVWKRELGQRLAYRGTARVVQELRQVGVQSAARVGAWMEPTLICPKRELDFELLLKWLGLPVDPSYRNALRLRKSLYKASMDLRGELEHAAGRADLAELERGGVLRLDVSREGFRGMMVTEVLGRSSFIEIIPRQQARVPFASREGRWLE